MTAQILGRNLMRWGQRIFLLLLSFLLATGTGDSLRIANPAQAAVNINYSPVNAGCYLVKPDVCKIHVEPFTINVTPGSRLIQFQLVADRLGANPQVIYDFRPDASIPAPYGGASTYTPTLVKRDFAAYCGASYTVSLQGEDNAPGHTLNTLGITNQFTCPKGNYRRFMPSVLR